MPNVDEEAFRHRSEQGGASFDEPDEDPLATFPALIVDLAPLLAVHDVDVGDGAARQVREAVLITLQNEWTAKSGELMEHGLAWHVPRCMSTQRREEHEARLPNAMLSVFEYPVELDDRKTAAMWRLVQRPTPYEVCDALKAEVANARRPLRWQADMAEELEELAEREQRCMELREDARHALDDVKREREDALARMHAAHHNADAPPLTPQQIHSMLGHLDDLDEQVAEAEAVLEEAVNVEGGAADDADERTLIDLLLDAIFEFYPNEPSAAAGPSAGPSHPSHLHTTRLRGSSSSWSSRSARPRCGACGRAPLDVCPLHQSWRSSTHRRGHGSPRSASAGWTLPTAHACWCRRRQSAPSREDDDIVTPYTSYDGNALTGSRVQLNHGRGPKQSKVTVNLYLCLFSPPGGVQPPKTPGAPTGTQDPGPSHTRTSNPHSAAYCTIRE